MKLTHSAATQAAHVYRGGGVGGLNNSSGKSSGFSYRHAGGGIDQSQWQVSVARTPCTKTNWMQAFGILQAKSGMVNSGPSGFSHGKDQAFATDGTSKDQCSEKVSCMAMMNSFASVYGI